MAQKYTTDDLDFAQIPILQCSESLPTAQWLDDCGGADAS